MSWLFSQALVADCLGHKKSDYTQSALSSWIGTADAFSHSDKMSDTYEVFSLYGMTFVPLTEDRGAAELMWCLEAFLVKHSVRQQEAGTTPPTCGLKCSG